MLGLSVDEGRSPELNGNWSQIKLAMVENR